MVGHQAIGEDINSLWFFLKRLAKVSSFFKSKREIMGVALGDAVKSIVLQKRDEAFIVAWSKKDGPAFNPSVEKMIDVSVAKGHRPWRCHMFILCSDFYLVNKDV